MLRVGLTGGLASGKGVVGKALAELGCTLIHADELGHQVLLKGGDAYEQVLSTFGTSIADANGIISRRALGAIVFSDADKLAALNAIIHPVVIRMEEDLIKEATERDANSIVVVEAAILIETGSYKRFDKVVLAVCTEEQQVLRAMERDKSTEAEARARLSRQMSLDEKRKHADYIVDTSGTEEQTLEQARKVYEHLRSLL